MDPTPIRRWKPGFIALRWRRTIGLFALTGLFSGVAVHLASHLSANTATGTVMLPNTPDIPLSEILRSDKLLAQTAIDELQAEVETRREQVDQAQKTLEVAIRSEAYAERHRRQPEPDAIPEHPQTLPNFPGPRPRGISDLIEARNKATAEFETAHYKLIKMMEESPVTDRSLEIQIAPGIRAPDRFTDFVLKLLKSSALGFTSGIMVALLLAYLLELLFPRKASAP
jgi:hypothetical protein